MFSTSSNWKTGLQKDLDPETVCQPFRELLADYLPMSLRELASRIGRDRTSVSKWKTGELTPSLQEQQKVAREVKETLREMRTQLERVEEMNEALQELEEAHEAHQGSWDEETRKALEEANERIRELAEAP